MRACADRDKTWINADILRLYCELFDAGHAHSIEVREDGALVGGLYGVSLRGAFFGESMFHRARDASKVALVHLVARLRLGGYPPARHAVPDAASGEPRGDRGPASGLPPALAQAMAATARFRGVADGAAMRGAEALELALSLRGRSSEQACDMAGAARRGNGLRHEGGSFRLTKWVPRDGPGRSIAIARWLKETPPDMLASRRAQAEYMFRRIGITFGVYGDKDAAERLIPFDIVPRVISRAEWTRLEAGLIQRVTALNLFLKDVYGARAILKESIVPPELILRNPYYRPEMIGRRAPHDIWVHIGGIDIVRVDDENFYVLEDNARTPSGVSYMLENREVTMRLMPDLFAQHSVAPVDDYPDELLSCLRSVAPRADRGEATIVLLTPGLSIPPTTNTRSWPTSSASNWSRDATCSSTTSSSCARRSDRDAST